MKRIFLSTLLVAVSMFLTAQTMKQSDQALNDFVRLNNTQGDRAQMYQALRTCYTGYLNILTQQINSANYNQARENLKLIYPYLQNAAAYYSQRGDQQSATFFACACVDMPKLDAFIGDIFPHDDQYPTIVYFAASNKFNAGDYDSAIRYYNEYIATGQEAKRKNAYGYLYKACVKVGNATMANTVMETAVAAYPGDYDILSMAINAAIDSQDYLKLSGYIGKALALRPNDPQLLAIQGKMYEDTRDYENALKVYTKMKQSNTKSLSVTEHIAQNTYNIGVTYFNKAALEGNKSTAKKLRTMANDYFARAAEIIGEILLSSPASIKWMQAQATAYSCTGDQKRLEAVNFKLRSMGQASIASNIVPAVMGQQPAAQQMAQTAPPSQGPVAPPQGDASSQSSSETIPPYSLFAKQYIEQQMKAWQAKDPYETIDEYKQRVNDNTQQQKVTELQKVAERDYIRMYSHTPTYRELTLQPYDAEHQVFLISSPYGHMVLPVPRANNEARIFETNWNGMQFRNPSYCVAGDTLTIAALTFVTPTGNSYTYDNQKELAYQQTTVNVQLAQIDYASLAQPGGPVATRKNPAIGTSDVDTNIPQSKQQNDRSFAVVIANENYLSLPHVPLAVADGTTFAKYCQQTLGLPKDHVRLYTNATLGSILGAVEDIRNISQAYEGDINIIFYYAGHGIPDESSKDAYLLPVDADGKQMAVCYSLRKLYAELSSLQARNVVVFLDACFSGATPDGGNLMASARGVALKPKAEAPQGNMVVFSAASDTETAYPYDEKGHGLFTYFLLKKLQESKGNATLKDLADYISKNVREKSVVVNHKPQTPVVTPSVAVSATWQNLKLK